MFGTLKRLFGGIGTETTDSTESPDETDSTGFDLDAVREQFPTGEIQGREFPLVPEDALDLGVHPRDSTWGNKVSVNFEDSHITGVHGWMTVADDDTMFVGGGRYVQDGDLFAYQMESGRCQVYAVVDVENERDPSDMFYANVEPVGYVEGTLHQ